MYSFCSNIAFQRLQQATNPQYNLTVRVEGTCDQRIDLYSDHTRRCLIGFKEPMRSSYERVPRGSRT